ARARGRVRLPPRIVGPSGRARARRRARRRRAVPLRAATRAAVRRRGARCLGEPSPAAARRRHAALLLLQARRGADGATVRRTSARAAALGSAPVPDYPKLLAELAVHVGADLQPGQDLVIAAWDPVQAPLVRAIAEEAYSSGARYVSPVYWDGTVKASRIRHAPDDSIEFIPAWFRRVVTESIEVRGAWISVTGDPNPGVFADVDQQRLGRDQMPYIPEIHDAIASRVVNWTVVPGPNRGWAERLFGEPDEGRLWETLTPILRMDADDPVQAWRDHVHRLGERAASLNDRGFMAVRFAGPGTELNVGLIEGHRWLNGVFPTTWGPVPVVNMPTEEVFTTPDYHSVEGTVRMTRPVQMTGGTIVDGLRLRFEGGRAVEVSADTNEDAVRSQLAVDAAARGSARSRSSTTCRRSARAGSCSATPCSTRTRLRTSLGGTRTRSQFRTCRMTRPSASGSASTAQSFTRTR